MRAVFRGSSPQAADYGNHRAAFPELSGRIGLFCSYCERRIATQLAVEHIQPKILPAYEHLKGRWENFLLGCVNCNSTKGDKDVVLSDVLLPDRDNTSAAYAYTMDGKVTVQAGLTHAQQEMAKRTLALTGLDKRASSASDSNGKLVVIDRVAQRRFVWKIALRSKSILQSNPNDDVRKLVAIAAVGHGFFSIWMTVFNDDIAVRKLLIEEFTGTATDCFDPNTTATVSPRPPNGLPHGSKI
jgi:uncharacterized protein (TIGR02646 family)